MARTTLILIIFSAIWAPLFAQFPNMENDEDSISIKIFGKGSFSELEISLCKGFIYLNNKRINEKMALRMSQGDTTITLGSLYEFKDTIIKNQFLYDSLRSNVYYWSVRNNVTEIDSASIFSELGLIKICIEIWRPGWRVKSKVLERCFYRVLGPIRYHWKPKFSEFYWKLYYMNTVFR